MGSTNRILIALIAGLAAGITADRLGVHLAAILQPIGGLWLSGLRMTVIPLVVSLIITGVAATAHRARGGRLALRSVALFIALLWLSTLMAAVLVPALLSLWPMPAQASAGLRSALGQMAAAPLVAPSLSDFLTSIVPANPIAAASGDAMLPLVVFTLVFALAITRLAADARERLVGVFSAIEQAMLVIVNWVFLLAPIGVFALAAVVGERTGSAAIDAFAHYIAVVSITGIAVWALAYPIAILAGRRRLRDFLAAAAPVQALALSTQSSLACLPAMLRASERLGLSPEQAGVPLGIAVAIFRVTSPAMNLAVAIYVAHWVGIELSAATIATGAVIAALTTLGSVSLPSQVSFFTSITPIAAAMGVPLEPLGVLIAVEMIPDFIRTVGNVTMDLAATSALVRHERRDDDAPIGSGEASL